MTFIWNQAWKLSAVWRICCQASATKCGACETHGVTHRDGWRWAGATRGKEETEKETSPHWPDLGARRCDKTQGGRDFSFRLRRFITTPNLSYPSMLMALAIRMGWDGLSSTLAWTSCLNPHATMMMMWTSNFVFFHQHHLRRLTCLPLTVAEIGIWG